MFSAPCESVGYFILVQTCKLFDSGKQSGAQVFFNSGNERIDGSFHDFILQRSIDILQGNPECKTFLIGIQTFSTIIIKQNNGLHDVTQGVIIFFLVESVNDFLHRH